MKQILMYLFLVGCNNPTIKNEEVKPQVVKTEIVGCDLVKRFNCSNAICRIETQYGKTTATINSVVLDRDLVVFICRYFKDESIKCEWELADNKLISIYHCPLDFQHMLESIEEK